MKKKQFYGMTLAAAMLLLTGCTADVMNDSQGEVPIYLTATVSEGNGTATRAGADVQSTQLPSGATFEAEFSDNVTPSSATYTADGQGGATTTTQPYFTLSGTSTTVHAYAPSKPSGTFSVLADQSSDANYRASDLLYATATVQKSSPVGALTFAHKMAKIIVNATLGDGISSISGVYIIGGGRTVNITDATTCALGEELTDDLSDSSPLTAYSGTHSEGTLSCAALLPPQTVTSSDFLKITTDQGDIIYSLDSKAFASGQSYTFNATVTAAAVGTTIAITGWEDNGSVTVEMGGGLTLSDRTPPGVTLVDLGLPSGTKWASRNIGAISDTDYGLYFAWGDVLGRSGAVSSGTTAADGYSFEWTNTPYNYGNSDFAATKYNATDGLTQLELCDDAAYMNWGGNWRMPTKAEWEELLNTSYCTWTWQSSPAGYRVTSKVSGYTSNSIFLPAAGFRKNQYMSWQGTYGDYLSSLLCSESYRCPDALHFDSGSAAMLYDYFDFQMYGLRYFGRSIRPVQSSE